MCATLNSSRVAISTVACGIRARAVVRTTNLLPTRVMAEAPVISLTGALDVAPPPRESNPTVRDVLQAIVLRLPGYQMTTRNGVVHITQPAFSGAAGNFLNVQIEEFQVEDENLLAAKEQLRLSIDMTLHPDDYEGGYAGGYGYNPDNVFAKRNISFTGKDLTVREILDGLVKANGNALWVAQLDLDDFQTAAKPSTTKPTKNSKPEEANSKYRWDFVPLVEKPATKSETRP